MMGGDWFYNEFASFEASVIEGGKEVSYKAETLDFCGFLYQKIT